MVYIVVNVWYPSSKSPVVAQRYIDTLKKFPPDRSISKTLAVMVHPSKEGMNVLSIVQPKKDKLEEALMRSVQHQEEYTNIEGFNYEIKTFLDYTEAYQVIDMKPPEEI